MKWVGGKRRLLPTLERLFPPGWLEGAGPLYEPFLGGGAFFWKYGVDRASYLQDANEHLAQVWLLLRNETEALLRELHALERGDALGGEDHFYSVRQWDRSNMFSLVPPEAKAARFLYIVAVGFNGLYRVNQDDQCNVPWGKRSFRVNEAMYRAAAHELQTRNVTMTLGNDWIDVFKDANPNGFVFLDPPYAPLTPTASFDAYTPEGFSTGAVLDLLDDVVACSAPAMVCNHNVPWLRAEAYVRGLHVTPVTAPRSVRPSALSTASEIVITNYEPPKEAP